MGGAVVRRPLFLSALVILAWLWVAAIVGAPAGPRTIGAATYLAGSIICHQKAERSFHLAGAQLPVCARCAGLYIGGAMGVSLWLLVAGWRRMPAPLAERLATRGNVRTLLALVAAPTVFTVASALSGLWDPQNAVRAALAVPFGCGLGAVVSAAAAGDLR